jgi:hypothetical protein
MRQSHRDDGVSSTLISEVVMALLRQCLQEVRMRHHEWDVRDADWPEFSWPQPVAGGSGLPSGCEDDGPRGEAFHASLPADQRHLS